MGPSVHDTGTGTGKKLQERYTLATVG